MNFLYSGYNHLGKEIILVNTMREYFKEIFPFTVGYFKHNNIILIDRKNFVFYDPGIFENFSFPPNDTLNSLEWKLYPESKKK